MTRLSLPTARGSGDTGAVPSQVIHFLDALLASRLCGQEPDKRFFLLQQGIMLEKGMSLFIECPESSGFQGPCEGTAPWVLGFDQIYRGSP